MDKLKKWFTEEKRDLPWRRDPSPYGVWVSEVMLQQTQVAVVLPYFDRWMKKFPTVHALAEASIEEVMKMWEGLGYYSRARFLHEGAKKIVREFGGELPADAEKLRAIKGFGPYTVGAVLSFAFHRKAAAVDGNVVRVVSRLFALRSREEIEERVFELLPDEEPWIVMEALIELGAEVCQKKPQCWRCPLVDDCEGYRQGIAEELPVRKKRVESVALFREVAVITTEKEVLVRREAEGKVMGGLYEFPYVENGEAWPFVFEVVEKHPLERVKHSFTKYRATLYPMIWKVKGKQLVEGFEWVEWDRVRALPFSSGHRRILEGIAK